ncbi:hypothetical protein [Leeuwenhoekiella parthenopeia]|uniref:XRE family transcriptional regulator n=1 Tax=Leeuwenhoekiella parthenopeia TaxID=2890320 RepID=A0ABS8GQC5_9FLAO|nr:hypothetical protein [Leeuwenhoekiella parthenopeia]MCC4211708.1 hypothetical protein [Leeuwenhoekiella parthenopeia]
MQINEKLKEVYANLPRGSKKLIVEESGLSHKTVYNFLNGEDCSFKTFIQMNKAIIKVRKKIQASIEECENNLNG